jgi:hypothetical protein
VLIILAAAGLVVTLVASWRRLRPAAHVLLPVLLAAALQPPPSRPGRDRRDPPALIEASRHRVPGTLTSDEDGIHTARMWDGS